MIALLPVHAAIEFNRDIRPILSDRCFSCHGPDNNNRKANLRLDVESAAKAKVVVPGDPDRSELLRRVTTASKALRMPPAYAGHDALPPAEVALLREWIAAGAPWQNHWAFLKPEKPKTPGGVHPIDYFVRERLRREGLAPSPEAPKHALVRRLSLDLTGLPPTPAEIDAFVNDSSPGAYEKLVDRLLASPRHAERMAIRWLENARYADTNGYQSDGVRSMWRWRDWVIDAFRENMPFDRFTIEQLAGDLLPNPALSQRIATAFHRNNRTSAEGGIVDEEFRVEYAADRVETTSTVWLGLTMGCARCHDHKYDPIRQRDYYSLFAFFNRTPEKGFVYNFGNEEPYVAAPTAEQRRKLDAYDARVEQTRRRWESLQPALRKAEKKWSRKTRDLDWYPSEGLVLEHAAEETFAGDREVDLGKEKARFNHRDPLTLSAWFKTDARKGAILSRNEDYFEGTGYAIYLIDGKLRFHFIFRWTDLGMRVETKAPVTPGEWHHVAVTYDGSMKARDGHTRIWLDGADQPLTILFDQHLWPVDNKAPFRIGAGGGPEYRFQGQVKDVRVYNRVLGADEIAVLARKSEADKRRLAFLDRHLPPELKAARDEMRQARRERDEYFATIPTVMVMMDSVERDTFILKRGAYDAPGEKVAAAVPAFLPPLPEGAPPNRLGLARWIVSRDNPLTARVIVNRYWQMLFGTGLVKTVEDFGSQGEPPVHPGLLDWLAVEFMDSGWNVRHILKTIVMSETYRQSSRVTPALLQKDPENRLLARGARFRLPPEMIRDQALAVSGLLTEKTGGPPVKPYQPPGLWQELSSGAYKPDQGEDLYRRSLYTYWRRTIQPPAMITFDSPTRETCVVRETRTNTPLQALNLMNDVTYVEASRKFAERMLREGGADPVGFAWRTALGRLPSPQERDAAGQLVARLGRHYETNPNAAKELLKQGDAPADPGLDPARVATLAGVASLLLNLDEMVTKE